MEINWIELRGYSISAQLTADGLSFEALDIIERAANANAAKSVKTKIIGRMAKDLRSDCLEEELDLKDVKYGCYCIGIGTGFEMEYEKGRSRIIYIGSGRIYSRIKHHLSGKLFEFARILNTIPLRFYFCDLSAHENGGIMQRTLEQGLLDGFRDRFDSELPLLNKKNAKASHLESGWAKGWDRPLQRGKGRSTTNWLLKPADVSVWKGALQ